MTTPNDPAHWPDAAPDAGTTDLPAPDDPGRTVSPPDAETTAAATTAYSPAPEHRPDWASPGWGEPSTAVASPVTPEPVPATATERVVAEPARRTGVGSVVAAAVLSAVLASGGTFLVLKETGALDGGNGGLAGAPVTSAGARVPVTIDESSAVIDAAAKAGPSVVRILVSGTTTDALGTSIPEQGVGSGIIFAANGWILTNRHVVTNTDGTTASSLTVELKDGHQYQGKVYGIDTLTDLAIVKIEATGLTAASIGSSADLQVGQLAIAMAAPSGPTPTRSPRGSSRPRAGR